METLKKGCLGNGNKVVRTVKLPKKRSLVIDEFCECYIRYGVEQNVTFVGEVPQCIIDGDDASVIKWFEEVS